MGQPAARVGDMHVCPMFDGPKPHVGGPILPPGVINVLIGGMPAATVGTLCTCASAPDVIIKGSFTVLIGGRPAARMGDMTAHGGSIIIGCPTVLIGDVGMGGAFAAIGIASIDKNGFPIMVQRSWWHITDWPELITDAVVDVHYGNITIKPDPNNPNFQKQVLETLIRLNSTPTMQKAFKAINNSDNNVIIIPYVPPKNWGPFNAYTLPGSPVSGQTGVSSTIGWDPNIHGFGLPGTTPDSSQPGSDIILAHEMTHATHNATGTTGNGPFNSNGSNVSEERNTVGLPAQIYNNPSNLNDPLNGTKLPDTNTQPYTENGVR